MRETRHFIKVGSNDLERVIPYTSGPQISECINLPMWVPELEIAFNGYWCYARCAEFLRPSGRDIRAMFKTPAEINDPGYWRDRAEGARLLAQETNDQASREAMVRVAENYDRLAREAEQVREFRSIT
jgi:hypothetical protein